MSRLAAGGAALLVGLAVAHAGSAQVPDLPTPVAAARAQGAETGPAAAAVPSTGPALRAVTLRGLRPTVVQMLLNGEPGGQLATAALAVPLTADPAKTDEASESGSEQRRRVALWIEIDGASFVEHNPADRARVEVYAYALGEGGRVAGYLAQGFQVATAQLGERIWQSGLKLESELELEPGSYRLRTLVLNPVARSFGLREAQLEIPGAAVDERPPASMLFAGPEQRDSWLAVSSSRGERQPSQWLAIRGTGAPSSPEALPVLVSGAEKTASIYGAPDDLVAVSATIELLTETTAANNDVVATVPAQLVDPEDRAPTTATGREFRFVPPDLPPGLYRSRARIQTPSASLLTRDASVLIVDKATRERDLLWPDMRSMLSSQLHAGTAVSAASSDVTLGAEATQRAGRGVRRLVKDYEETLAQLAASSGNRPPEAVITRLFELESESLGKNTSEGLRRLLTAELQAGKEIQRRHVDAMLPVIDLHFQMVERYRNRRLYSLVYHSRRIVEVMAERYAEAGGSPVQAARFLSAQAGRLQRARLVASSRRLFHRALAHDAGSPSALLGLAASYEAYGQYNEAAELLTRLVEIRPELDEARLRLAINQQRLGRSDRAKELLSELVRRDQRDWVCVLAHQELAKNALARGDAASALQLLETAVALLPSWNELRLPLAYAYDRLGRSGSALEQLQVIDPAKRAGAPSARWTYDQWPDSILDQEQAELSTSAVQAWPLLTEALTARGVELKPPNREDDA